mmetsp:Transcript_39510/g.72374  ORF Transcript_39510/g.72374 Transcript_39510/m.72374 type:complete len:321 (+) Transcript_39510:448-1410(+)
MQRGRKLPHRAKPKQLQRQRGGWIQDIKEGPSIRRRFQPSRVATPQLLANSKVCVRRRKRVYAKGCRGTITKSSRLVPVELVDNSSDDKDDSDFSEDSDDDSEVDSDEDCDDSDEDSNEDSEDIDEVQVVHGQSNVKSPTSNKHINATSAGTKRKVAALLAKSTLAEGCVFVNDDDYNTKKTYTLVSPTANKISKFWKHFKLFHPVDHPEMKTYAHCNVGGCTCHAKISHSTSGLSSHLRHHHRPLFDTIMGIGVENQIPVTFVSSRKGAFVSQELADSTGTYQPKSLAKIFPNKLSTAQIMVQYRAKATWWAIGYGVLL